MDDKFIDNIAAEVNEREESNRKALAFLLEAKINTNQKLLVHKVQMGPVESFVGSVTLDWLSANVQYASSLPILESEDIEMKQQRQLDWSRQDEMVRYLVQIKNHKFAPVLVVQTRDWVYRDNADEWGENKKAQKSTINFEPLDYKGNIGLIDIGDGTYSYALDGQHRLMAIKGLIDFINTGKLLIYDKEKNKKNEMTAEDLKIPLENLQKLKYERIGIEFITAVCKGEKKEDAFIKVRSIFTHVNKYAKKLTKSEQAQLDEDNGFAIVARKSVKDSPLLNTEGKNPRVEIAYAVLKDDEIGRAAC